MNNPMRQALLLTAAILAATTTIPADPPASAQAANAGAPSFRTGHRALGTGHPTSANGTQLESIAIGLSGAPAASSPNGTTLHTALSVPIGHHETSNANGHAVTIGFFATTEFPPSAIHDWMILEQ